MSVIIRLQNLPWSANALDIRQYFHGLSIPEGGVHIVGGELGDAFIAFSTDEDARQAFIRNNGKIKEIQITLMLSSRTEMQRVIEQARSKSYAAFMQPTPTPSQVPLPAAVPPVVPAAVPDIKKEIKEKPEKRESRRRSRSKSRDRDKKDRSRDRDRKDKRHRDRSRSRSRDRKSSRRRDRSRSRNRSRSRERERRSRDHRKRSEERVTPVFPKDVKKPQSDMWPNTVKPAEAVPPPLMPSLSINLDPPKRGPPGLQPNGFPNVNNFNRDGGPRNNRDSWPPTNQNPNNFQNNRPSENFSNTFDQQYPQNRFQRNFPGRGNRMDNNMDSSVALEPFYGGYGDVRKFFQGMFISNKGIKFINDAAGRRTGIVYIQFADKRAKEDALNLNGSNLNGLTVSVTHIENRDFDEALDRYTPRNEEDNSNDSNYRFRNRNISKYFPSEPVEKELQDYSCLVVDDLPTYCKEQDILHMFALHPLVALILLPKRRGGHIAYVKFSSKDVARKAHDEKSHHIVGGKTVTVKPCKDADFEEINKKHEVNLNSPKTEDIGSDCLSVSKLPQKTNDKDIADFFSDIGVIPTKIHLMSNNLGFTGQAYCEFLNNEEATRAAKKNDTPLGSAMISVEPINREEMMTILGSTVPAPPEPSNVPAKLSQSEKIIPSQNSPSVTVPSTNNFGGPPNRPFFNRNFENGPPRGPPRFGPRGQGPRMRFPPHQEVDDVPPGCTIYMKNVPYKAGTNDILNFFEGYNHTGNVSRRYNPNNTPSDEAKVIFFDPEEATRAIEELEQKRIWDRQIFLRQD